MSQYKSLYQPANPKIWQGRSDSLPGERFFQQVTQITTEQIHTVETKQAIFLGFASDAGIVRNQGRAGAKLGPDKLKTQLAKLPYYSQISCLDLGNIICEGDDLETAQNAFAYYIAECQQAKHLTIGFGGGHEIAWAHFQGLAPHYPELGIVNFDAHFDLRPSNPTQKATSGTPFMQIAQFCQEKKQDFNYCCLGIQPHGNTPSLFETAQYLNVNYLTAEQMYTTSLTSQIAFLDNFLKKHQYIYLSICLDVFASCFAPGVSAPQTLGLTPWQALPLLKYLVQSGKVIGLDIAELSPPLDEGEKTANLAAILVAELLSGMFK
jgi:formiminoglutamase